MEPQELNEKQIKIYNMLRAGGFDAQRAMQYSVGEEAANPVLQTGLLNIRGRLSDIPQDIVQGIQGIANTWSRAFERVGDIREDLREGTEGYTGVGGNIRAIGQTAGTLAGAAAGTVGEAVMTGLRVPFTQQEEDTIASGFASALRPVVETQGVQGAINWYNNLSEERQRDIDALGGVIALAAEISGAGPTIRGVQTFRRGVQRGIDEVGTAITTGRQSLRDIITSRTPVAGQVSDVRAGLTQTAEELAGRIPRGVERVQEGITEAAARRRAIQEATPARAEAIRAGVDDVLLQRLDEVADQPTLRVVREINEAASDPRRGGQSALARLGDEAEEAYNFINTERQRVGQQIEDQIRTLGRDVTVDLNPMYTQLDNILAENGITHGFRGNLEILSGYSPDLRRKIQELYDEATRLGNRASPLDIYRQDRVFSQMQRQSRFDGIGDVFITMPDGSQQSLFRVLRDVYRETLEGINPEIRRLNAEYAPLRQLQDELDDTIFRAFGNYDSLRGIVSRGDYTQNAFRRMFSNAQSAEDYRQLVNLLETRARELGYTGANLEQAAELGLMIQRLYPQTGVQATSLEGIMGATRPDFSIGGIASRIFNVGRPQLRDQQRALTNLLNELTQ